MIPTFTFLKKNKVTQDNSEIFVPSRRDFIKIGSLAGGGLLLGVNFQCTSDVKQVTFAPNVYLSVSSDNRVTIIAHRSEMGQGIRTSLPMIVADEMGADWSKVQVVQADGDEETYGNQNTDGSFSVRMFYEPMRKAGATARYLLLQAAAQEWGVSPSSCTAENGKITHADSGKTLSFGALATAAQQLPLPDPESVTLKDFSSYKLIGKDVPIIDLADIVTGKAVFGADVQLPGMKIAVIQRTPIVGATLASYDDTAALAIPGVEKIMKINGSGNPPGLNKPLEGLAVIATNTWAAIKGREALKIVWEKGANASYDSAVQMETMKKSTLSDGQERRVRGNFTAAKKSASKVLDRTYEVPFYAHATIEPPAAIAEYKNGKMELWAPTQHPQWARGSVAEACGLDVADVTIHVTLLGGGFGRKSKPDYVVEAALLAKEAGVPIRVQWTREDDLHHDFYHAHSAQRIVATLDAKKQLTGWNHHTVFPSIGATSSAEERQPSDGELGLGCIDFPYEVPHIRIETHESTAHTRIGWMRSVSNIHHAFAICSMMDEIAEARGVDPVAHALELLADDAKLDFAGELKGSFENYGEPLDDFPWETKRLKEVIRRVAKEANWGAPLPSGSAMGFAVHKSFLTYVACIVTITKDSNGKITIPEVHYAVDCGIAVNTDRVRSQFEGGAIFGTSIANTSAITLKSGEVAQHNFDGYLLARMSESPKNVHVHLVENGKKPTGVGEPPVPPLAPALANAYYKLTGKRVYTLPFSLE
ncbi:molybdopterin cofactor-binding domain-containing protein [Arenibacter sp. GZD96]|uniref:xanthine dehydrogenase family protein molybdopterin-binding subunit n=1 Tax=Aurantibrevibacter litoralis TaxID=3106030 RepID=UPI002AFE3838|nr:molybdopterin cofactor-binding domain-containing protein [Arenibacter sp. GZD-96]MEA1786982.1 molybdopterin cofactor-binding domain-containing protein [Arenibacter sp. GZD-96]